MKYLKDDAWLLDEMSKTEVIANGFKTLRTLSQDDSIASKLIEIYPDLVLDCTQLLK